MESRVKDGAVKKHVLRIRLNNSYEQFSYSQVEELMHRLVLEQKRPPKFKLVNNEYLLVYFEKQTRLRLSNNQFDWGFVEKMPYSKFVDDLPFVTQIGGDVPNY